MKLIGRVANSRYFLWLLLALPLVLLWYALASQALYYGEVLHVSGELSARLLIAALAVTPLCLMFPRARWPRWLLRRRRYFGVAAFAYGFLHAAVYIDKQGEFDLIVRDGLAFDMWTGWAALAIFLVLALTSNNLSMRSLGRGWKRLHRWVYVAALLAFAHWIFIAFDFIPALLHFLLLVSLQAVRLWKQGPGS